jgi:hypothetical protein
LSSAFDETGTHEELYDEFLTQYDAEAVEEVVEEKPAKVAVVRKTAAEKEAETQKKKEEREAAAKEKKEAREAAAKEKKEAREAAAKEKKEAAAKKTEKPVKAVASPKAAVVKAVVKAPVAAKAVTPVKVAAPVKAPAAPQKKKAEEVWSCEDDGCVKPWSYKGKKYMRDFGNNVWVNKENLPTDWCGVYIPSEDRIDDSAEEPLLEDE